MEKEGSRDGEGRQGGEDGREERKKDRERSLLIKAQGQGDHPRWLPPVGTLTCLYFNQVL